MKRLEKNIWIKSSLLALTLSVQILSIEALRADTLCYKTNQKNKNTLKIFKNDCASGYSSLSAEAFDSGKTFTKGTVGEVGIKGEIGAQGLPGLKGDTGIAGEIGSKGTTGIQGQKGEIGDPGPKGATGDTGPDGFSAKDLFYFNGSTGSTSLGSEGDLQIYPFNQSEGPTSGFVNTSDLLIPIGSSCSKVTFMVTIETPPGAGNFWKFELLYGGYGSTPLRSELCTMTGAAKICSNAPLLQAPLGANTSIALLGNKLGTLPPDTKARWSFRCTAP